MEVRDDGRPAKKARSVPSVGSKLASRPSSPEEEAAQLRLTLEADRALLASIVQSSDDAIISKTLDGIILSWNDGAERIFGYTADEAVGRSITLTIPPERLEEERKILQRLRQGERIEHYETVRLGKNGRAIDVSLTVSPLRDAEGKIIGASKVARDITGQRRAAASLRESEERHRFFSRLSEAVQPLTEADEVLAVTMRLLAEQLDADRCAYAEVEDESVFVIARDYTRDVPSVVGRWPLSSLVPSVADRVLNNEPFIMTDVEEEPGFESKLPLYRDLQIRALMLVPLRKQGKLSAAMAVHQKQPRRWTAGEVELARAVLDRSWESIERTKAVRELQMAAENLALALAAANLGDWRWDAGSDRVVLSARASEIFGVPPKMDCTWTWLQDMIVEEDRERTRRAVEHCVATREHYNIEYRVQRTSGVEVWVSAIGKVMYDSAGHPLGMFGVVQDITDRKLQEQELLRRAEELAESDRKKDDFIALLAHELRNPLAPVRTGLEVIRIATAGDAGEAISYARSMMDRQLTHMVRLIDDLLDVSRINRSKLHLQKSRVALSEVINDAVETARPMIESARHTLKVLLPPEPIFLEADLTRLAQVFGNLLSNSAKYTNQGGTITLTAELHGEDVVIKVQDNGIGIPVESLPRIFEMFSQVDRDTEKSSGGLGIGLALVRGLTEMHGGSVTAESKGVGTGSSFTVRLPVLTEAVSKVNGADNAHAQTFPAYKKILVVDDNRDGAESMATMLSLLGKDVQVAYDGREAVEKAESIRPDLILMDVGMPGMDGLDATREIRGRSWSRDVSIIALTGWGQEGDRDRTRAAGCDGHLVKPVSLSDLNEVLRNLSEADRR